MKLRSFRSWFTTKNITSSTLIEQYVVNQSVVVKSINFCVDYVNELRQNDETMEIIDAVGCGK